MTIWSHLIRPKGRSRQQPSRTGCIVCRIQRGNQAARDLPDYERLRPPHQVRRFSDWHPDHRRRSLRSAPCAGSWCPQRPQGGHLANFYHGRSAGETCTDFRVNRYLDRKRAICPALAFIRVSPGICQYSGSANPVISGIMQVPMYQATGFQRWMCASRFEQNPPERALPAKRGCSLRKEGAWWVMTTVRSGSGPQTVHPVSPDFSDVSGMLFQVSNPE